MKIVVMGTGGFAVPTLESLWHSGHEVVQVVCRPPRGKRGEPTAPMRIAAEQLGAVLWMPDSVNTPESQARLRDFAADLLVVCDYGEILRPATLETARLGGINLHGSLLPKYRGAAPVQWAILQGETITGNTVIQMTPGVDAGPTLAREEVDIDPEETAGELEQRLAQAGAMLVLNVVEQLQSGETEPVVQEKSQATKAPRLTKEVGAIDWTQSAQAIKNRVRALSPWPRTFTFWYRPDAPPLRLNIDRVAVLGLQASHRPGTVVSTFPALVISAGEGAVEILQLQAAGKRSMAAEDFLRGNAVQEGDRFGALD